jgi:Protein of unknown function (DUF3243)
MGIMVTLNETAKKCIDVLDFMKDWAKFRQSLHEGIQTARKYGMSDSEIENMAVKVGDLLNEKVCPSSKEEQLLKEMWDVASPEERKIIASVLFKMVK